MLLSLTPVDCGELCGIVVLLHRQWTSSAAIQSEEIVSSYSEALFRLHSDTESTKPYLGRLGSGVLSDLESAAEISLRRLPERFRKGCSLFQMVEDRRAEKTRIHYKLPPWIHLTLMNERRNAFEIKNANGEWRTFDAAKDGEAPGPWREALLNFFASPSSSSLMQTQQNLPGGITYFRVAELIQRTQIPALAPCYSLTLSSR
ncbi:MAG: hypothetical protein ABIR96_03705 [Bdellovibrionota bacterium]